MKPIPITVIILTNRIDKQFLTALKSAQFASEVLLVDNQTGNDWTELSKQYPLQILSLASPIKDFSKVRNEALAHAQNDWVFFLDSDEEVQQPVIPQLAALITSPSSKGGVVTRSDVFYGKTLEYGEAGNQPLIRIGHKRFMTFHGKTHETATIKGELTYTNIKLLHHAHPTITEFIDDVSRYAQEVAKEKKTTVGKNFFEMIFFPPAKLLYSLIIQGGVLDGWQGIVYAWCMSLHSVLVRVYRYEILARVQDSKR